jgi:hypothetical protein
MRRSEFILSILLVMCCDIAAASELSDAQIREMLIRQSIAMYSGNCPCPFSRDRAARLCGGRSAYSKPGGRNPICYPSDVTDEMIRTYRATN